VTTENRGAVLRRTEVASGSRPAVGPLRRTLSFPT
jgi:hypothetical protein